jgi:predicted Zn-dependent peptidase
MRFKIFAILFLASLFFAPITAQAGHRLIQRPLPDDPMQVHTYQLDNGLQVYLTANSEEPRFYAEIIVRAGSKHDPQDATGIAHYLEHMLFKGSRQMGTLDYGKEKVHLDRIEALYEQRFYETDPEIRAQIYAQINEENQLAAQYAIPNELDRLYTGMGERALNAHTWVEETVYKVDLPANRLEHWTKVEAERFHQPVFRLFQTELETVYEEKNRSMDNKDRVIRKAVQEQFYKNHPYRNTTLGSVDHLKNPSLARMYEFYHTYYVPNNMAIAISGDIDIEHTIELVDREFSLWQAKELPKQPRWKEPKIKDVERIEVTYPGEEYVLLALRTAPRTHKDAEALQILDMILDNSTAGLINLNLNQQQRVREAGSYPWLHNDHGAQYLWGIPKQDQTLAEVEELLLEQIELIKSGQFDDWIIPAIVTDFKKTYKKRLEGNGPRVSLMRDSYLSFEKWDHAVATLERMGKLRKKDIVKVANKYFKNGYVAAYRRDGQVDIPPIDKPPIEKIDIDPSRQSAFSASIAELVFEEIEPSYVVPGKDYTKEEFRDGVQLYHARNPLNDLFSLEISIDTGNLTEKRLDVAHDLIDKSGTPRFSSEDLKKEWYKLGTDFSLGIGDQQTTISISGLDENFSASLALMVEALRQPTTDDATLDELKQIILTKREDAVKDQRTVHQALYRYHRLGDNARYRRVLSNEQVQALTREELLGLIRGLLDYEQTLSYTGTLSATQLKAMLTEHYPLPADLKMPPQRQVLENNQPTQTQIYFFDKEMAQAQVRIEFGGVPYSASLEPAVELFNDYFYGGMAGIVFQEIREARALAYSVGALYFNGSEKNDYNLMVGSMGTQADKTPEALGALVELLDDMPVSQERFTAAQGSVISKYRTERLGFRQILGSVRGWERKQVPVDPRPWRFEQIMTANLDKVLDFQREHIKGRAKLISITGDKNKIDMEALGQHGEIIEIGLDQLFAF